MKIISNLHTEFYWVRQSSFRRIKYIFVLVALMLGLTIKSYSKNYYFSSSTGNDSYTAIQAQDPNTPWKTIDQLNKSMNLFTAGDYILFNRGDTFYGTITIAKSGTSGSPIVISAYGTGNDPIITGFTTITGWTNEGGGIYSKVITSESQTNMVTIDGVNTGMGRFPDATYNTYESYSTNVSITDNGLGDATDWAGAEVVIRKNDCTLDRCLITDHTGDKLTYTNLGTTQNATANYGYFIQNDLRCVTAYGEWYHNTSTGKFYMYFGAVDPTTKTVKVATINNLISYGGYDYITIDNLSLTGSISDIFGNSSNNDYCVIQNCNISFSGGDGIAYENSSDNVLIDNNQISYCNRAGITAWGTSITTTNNLVSNIGVIKGQAFDGGYADGIYIGGASAIIRYNNVSNIGYNGIFIRNVGEQTLEYNFIDSVCLVLNDGGGIYTAGTDVDIRTIDHNIVLNVTGNIDGTPKSILNASGVGIYLDEYSDNTTVTNNTIAHCIYGIQLHKANTNTIEDNTLFNNNYEMWFHNTVGSSTIFDIAMNSNIFFAKTGTQYALGFRSEINDISSFGTADNNYYARPIDDDYTFHLYQPSFGHTYKTLAEWQTFTGQDTNSHKASFAIADTADIDFYYNATKVNKAITLNKPMIDVKGTKYANSITLLPFTSLVLMVDPNPAQSVIPVYTGSVIENATPSVLEIVYNVNLASIIPAGSDFTVLVNSAARTVNAVTVSGTKVLLTLGSPVIYGDNVTISYTKPSINPLQTAEGGPAATLGAQTVTNKVNPASPVFISSAIENATPSVLEIVYNVNLAGIIPAGSAFTVLVNSAARIVNAVSVSGSKVLLTLASPVVYSDNVTISYTKPSINPLQTATGGQAATIPAQTVTNNVSFINAPPVVVINSPASNLSGFISQIDATGSYDANNDNLSYTWVVPDDIPVSSTNSSKIQFLCPIVNALLTVEFTLKISDGKTTQYKIIPVEILPYKPELEVAEVLNVEASGFQSPNYPHNILDGNIGTLWAANGNNQWLILELKEPFNIQHVKLAFQLGQRRESYFDILGSRDKVIWEPILTKSASCAFSGDIQVFDFPPSKTEEEFKYVKLVGQSNSVDSWNYISEFEIFGYKHRNPTSYEQQPVKVYPNPVRELINIRIDETAMRPDFIRIINLSGKVVFQDKVMQDIKEFQIPINLINGAYVVQMGSGDLTLFTQKLIIIN